MRSLEGHSTTNPVRSIAFSPGGTKLASSAHGSSALLWDLVGQSPPVVLSEQSHGVAFSPDGGTVVTGAMDALLLTDLGTGSTRSLVTLRHSWGFRSRFTPCGTRLYIFGDATEVRSFPNLAPIDREIRLGGEGPLSAGAISGDGALVATASPVGRIHRVAVRGTRERDTDASFALGGDVSALAFHPDGRRLAACTALALWVWDVPTRRVALRLKDADPFLDVAFSPDGRLLLFACGDDLVRLRHAHDGSEAATLDFGLGPVTSVAFAPDGMRAATGTGEGKVVLFDIDA